MHDLPAEAVERFARVNKLLKTQKTLPAKLETVVEICKRTIANCDSAGVVLLIDGKPTTSAVSDRLAVQVDLVQYDTGEGPCLAAIDESHVVRIDILERDSRFTRFAPGALDLEIESVLSLPLAVGNSVVGALNLYSRTPDGFDHQAEQVAQPLAAYAAELIATSPLYAYSLDMVDGLVESLENQAIIAQATGLIMVIESRTSDQAMDQLREAAMASGKSMRAVADAVIDEHPTVAADDLPEELRAVDNP
jgi:GAF domain-containing protein